MEMKMSDESHMEKCVDFMLRAIQKGIDPKSFRGLIIADFNDPDRDEYRVVLSGGYGDGLVELLCYEVQRNPGFRAMVKRVGYYIEGLEIEERRANEVGE